MDKQEQLEAGEALMDWFASQGIDAVDAAGIMHKLLYALLMELADECRKARSN